MAHTPRIDVHMLTLGEPEAWRNACIQSLSGAPITLRLLPGVQGDVGAARANGFAWGESPFVSFVDPDDLYNPAAFAALAEALDATPAAGMAYSDESRIGIDGAAIESPGQAYSAHTHHRLPSHVHGLMVFRRVAIAPHLPLLAGDPIPEWTLTRLIAVTRGIIHVPVVGRYWRQHPNQYHRTLNLNQDPDHARPD